MDKRIWIAALAVFVMGASIGCGEKAEDSATSATPEATSSSGAQTENGALTAESGATNASIVDYTNDKGEVLCPVMKNVIADKSKAVSYQDHEGMRYYFCCDGCPDEFKADPAKFAMVNHGDHTHAPGEEAH